ncbi:MAG: acyl-CoA dehydrogenase family protein [Methylocystis sp.]|uniref:acyl-CoA dehydrogenase family protein n=1 Tax=Methylocystis sp. TaxID=1911079 RepID=UPI003DA5B2AC
MSTQNENEAFKELDDVIEKIVAANAERNDEQSIFPRENLEALAAEGWTRVLIPHDYGGLGLDHVAFAEASYRIGQKDASTGLVYVMHVGAAQTVNLYGTHDQKERWLRPNGKYLLGTYSTSERASGGHWWYNFSEASRDGEDYIVNAEKSFTTSAGKADYYITQTRTPGARDQSDISFFIVDGGSPGITPGPWNALGVRGNHSGPIRYDGVKVPKRDRLGEENQGKEIIYNGVSPIYLIGLGAVWEGVARGVYDTAVNHIKNSFHQDTNKRLADYQAIRQELAKAKVHIESLGAWRRELASRLDTLWRSNSPQAELLIALTEFKVHASETANVAAAAALTVTGGYGYKKGALERYFRDARAGIGMGPSNIIARDWIGKTSVGLPLELFYEGGE